MEQLLKNFAENLKQITEALPKHLEQVQKNLKPEEKILIKKAMKDSGYNEAMKNLEDAKNKFNEFKKQY